MVQRKLIQSLLVGTGEVSVLQPFVQRQIERSVPSIRLLRLFFFFSFSPCLWCLFTFFLQQSLNLFFCYPQLSHFISARAFLWKSVGDFRGCFAGCYSVSPSSFFSPHSLLQHSFAMPFHPLPSFCWAPFELFKSGLERCPIPFKRSTEPSLWIAWLGWREEKSDFEDSA